MRVIIITLATTLLILPAQAKYSGGSGEPTDPYQIATVADLLQMNSDDSDKCFVLLSDVDLNPDLPNGRTFGGSVCHDFSGTFDGNGFVVRNFTLRSTGASYVGFFGVLRSGAQIKNLGIVNASIKGVGDCGGVLAGGVIDLSYVYNCYTTGDIHGNEDWHGNIIGGLVGLNSAGIVTKCHSSASVTGATEVGGLLGVNHGDCTDCYANGTVTGDSSIGGLTGYNSGYLRRCFSSCAVDGGAQVGGLTGHNFGKIFGCFSNGTVIGHMKVGGLVGSNDYEITSLWVTALNVYNCYSTCSVSGDTSTGGLVGWKDRGLISNCFWDVDMSGLASSAGGKGLTTQDMRNITTYLDAGWDFVDEANDSPGTWQIDRRGGYPTLYSPQNLSGKGTLNDPYLISSAIEFNTISSSPSTHYVLMDNVNLSGLTWTGAVVPIFAGTFDGNGFAVRGLTIQASTNRAGECLGLFGKIVEGAEVINLSVIDANVIDTGLGDSIGGLAGENLGDVRNCSSSGSIRGESGVGGLIGSNYGSVSDCNTVSSVFGYYDVGGLVGINRYTDAESGPTFIENSYSNGTVSGNSRIGGLLGNNSYDASLGYSYSDCTVDGIAQVGGLVGISRSNVSNCYSRGSVTGGAGLVGYNDGSVVNCYSTGAVSGNWATDGRGLILSNVGDVTNSFWDVETSGKIRSEGGEGLDTAEMQALNTYLAAGWDFVDETGNGVDDIWWLDSGQDYPRLWWELIGKTIVPDVMGLKEDAAQNALVAAGLVVGTLKTAYSNTIPSGCVIDQKPGPSSLVHLGSPIDITVSLGLTSLDGQGTRENPYRISSLALFHFFADPSNAEKYWSAGINIRLECDIDLANRIYSSAVVAPDLDGASKTFEGMLFGGTFDGNGFCVQNLTLLSETHHLGLFGRLSASATVMNLSFKNALVEGSGNFVGTLAGFNAGGRISNCSSTGTVFGNDSVGGLVGGNSGNLSNCHSKCTVTGHYETGGLVGRATWGNQGGTMLNCYSTGEVKGYSGVGGLVGAIFRGMVFSCYSISNVNGSYRIGGLVGDCMGEVSNCYSTGMVTALDQIGGLVGYVSSSGSVTGSVSNCYSTGAVASDRENNLGGLIGGIYSGTVSNCFWDTETSGTTIGYHQNNSYPGIVSYVQGLTIAQMQTTNTFLQSGWDFVDETENGTDDIWWIDDGQNYPRLWWERTEALTLEITVVGSVADEILHVEPNATITYKISVRNNSASDMANVVVLNTLSNYVSFVSASLNAERLGQYDPASHTFVWSYSSLAPEASADMELTVQVRGNVAPNTVISNEVTATSDLDLKIVASVDVIVD